MCGALWLLATHGDDLPIEPTVASSAYRDVPAERSEREQALLGCGAAYGTSCDEDGVDLRLADAGVLHQWFPGLATVLPDAGDSDVVQRVAWNWYAAQLMRRGVEPGVGDAADCTFETPGGCADLDVAGPRFPARRVLPDEPIAGPEIRWDWELGTTFELGPVEVEGDVSPQLLALVPRRCAARARRRPLRRRERRARRGGLLGPRADESARAADRRGRPARDPPPSRRAESRTRFARPIPGFLRSRSSLCCAPR